MRIFVLALLVCLPAVAFAGSEPNRITHGPILGRAGAHEMGIWARTARAGSFRVRYGTKPDTLDRLSEPASTWRDHDNTGWIHLKGLKSRTTYYYQLVCGDDVSPKQPASFHTWATADDFRNDKHNPKGLINFRFEVGCCNDPRPGRGTGPDVPAFKTMLDRLRGKVDFAILNGDWLYEENRDHKVEDWCRQVGLAADKTPRNVQIAPPLVGVWENYKTFLTRGQNLAAWHREVPTFFTFDDHEMLNDVWGAGQAGVRERRALFRDIGQHAWYDYLGWSNPTAFKQGIHLGKANLKKGSDILVDPAADFSKLDLKQAATLHVHWGKLNAGVDDNKLDEEKPGNPNAGVFAITEVLDKTRLRVKPAAYADGTGAAYSIGRKSHYRVRHSNCEFFMLDTRTHRTLHDLKDRAKKGISMIGQDQKAWLKDAMKNSDADFLFVVSTVTFMIAHVGGGYIRESNKDDAWTVFLEEREELMRFWDSLGKPVILLTGDLHNSFAIKITDRVWEFACGPHNSQNHKVGDEGGRPASGVYDSFGRKCDIRWSTYFLDDIDRKQLKYPYYCVVQVNNAFNSPQKLGEERWVAYPRPQVVLSYYNGRTGDLMYAEALSAAR